MLQSHNVQLKKHTESKLALFSVTFFFGDLKFEKFSSTALPTVPSPCRFSKFSSLSSLESAPSLNLRGLESDEQGSGDFSSHFKSNFSICSQITFLKRGEVWLVLESATLSSPLFVSAKSQSSSSSSREKSCRALFFLNLSLSSRERRTLSSQGARTRSLRPEQSSASLLFLMDSRGFSSIGEEDVESFSGQDQCLIRDIPGGIVLRHILELLGRATANTWLDLPQQLQITVFSLQYSG